MNLLKTLGRVAVAIIPSLKKERAKINSVDTLISKKGDACSGEIIVALIYKIIRLLLMAALVYAIVSGRVTTGELIKAISTVTSIGL